MPVERASSKRQRFNSQLSKSARARFESRSLQQLSGIGTKNNGKLIVSIVLIAALFFWNWQLWLATAMGVAVMLLVYILPEWRGHLPLTQLRKWLTGVHRQLVLAVGSGGIAALSTYMATVTWKGSESPWLASGAILQGLGTLSVLVILLWSIFSRQAAGEETRLQQMLIDLTDANSLKRLVAVGYIGKQILNSQTERQLQRQLINYLCVMLNGEVEPLVRNAILEILKKADPDSLKPLNLPLKLSTKQEDETETVLEAIQQEVI